MIGFLINSLVWVLIWESWSFLRWWREKTLCGKDTCCNQCCWLCWMCVTCKSRSVRLSVFKARQADLSEGDPVGWKPAIYSVAKVKCSAAHDVQQRRQTHQELRGKKTPWQNSCLCWVPDHTPMVNHIHTHTHTHTTNTYMFEFGLVQRNEFTWHFDCP